MKRGVDNLGEQRRDTETVPPAAASGGFSRRRALLVLVSPLVLLLLLAVLMRLGGGADRKPGTGGAEDSGAGQPSEKVQHVDEATQKELEATVVGQLSALRRRDFDGALTFAHKSFRDHWSSRQFQDIIEKSGFAIMPVSSRQECRKALQANKMTTILVTVRKADGDGAGFVYGMVQEEGKWRIAACTHALDPAIAEMPQ